MTEKDKKIRKLWLFSNLLITLYNVVYSQIRVFQKLNVPFSWTAFTFTFITSLLLFYVYYCCAYKKPGTKLLTLALILTPIFYVINLIYYFQGSITFAESGLNPLQFALAIWLYVLTWKMRTINKRLKGKSA